MEGSQHTDTHAGYLKPLSMGLHFEDHTGVWLGEGVPVRDAPARHPQLHLGEAGRADEAQGGLS